MLENGRIHLIQFEYGGTHIDARIFLKDFFALLQPYGYALHKIHPMALKIRPLPTRARHVSIPKLAGRPPTPRPKPDREGDAMLTAPRPLRIFYAAADAATADVPGSRIWYHNLFLPLVELGHDVIRFEYDLGPHVSHRDFTQPQNREFIQAHRPHLEAALLKQLEKAHQERPLDLFLAIFMRRM